MLRQRIRYVAACTAICLIGVNASLLQAADWPQWRGPSRDGTVHDFDVPVTWPDTLSQVWKVRVGAGLSSPVVRDNRIYLFTRIEEKEVLSCYDFRDGQLLWRESYTAPFIPNPQAVITRFFPESRGKGPFATPLLFGDQVFTLGIDRVLSSLDAEAGALKWRQHFLKQSAPTQLEYECPPCGCTVDGQVFAEPGACPDCGMTYGAKGVETSAKLGGPNYYGAAASPLAVDGVIVVHVGNAQHGTLRALDPNTGETHWSWEGPPMSSSSPVVAVIGGMKQIVVLTRTSLAGLSAPNGQLLWSFPLESNAQIVTPIVFEDLVIFSAYRSPTTAVRVAKRGSEWAVEQAWENSDVTLYTSTPVIDKDRLYGLSYAKRGQFFSMNVRTGETIWTSEGRQAQGSAILDVGPVFLALTDTGNLRILAKDGKDYRLLKEYQVSEMPTWAHPVLHGRHILIKDEKNLVLWSL